MPAMARTDPFASPQQNISNKMESLFRDSSPDYGPVKCEVNKTRAIGDMTAPAVPHAGFRERSLRLRHLEDDKNALIDDLIRQLEIGQHQLQQLRLDHERETKYSRECQIDQSALQDEMTAMRSLLDRNAYVTVLIDGDALTFAKEFWNKGENGGVEAAQAIHDLLSSFAKDSLPHLASLNIHAKLFLNLRTVSETLTRSRYVEQTAAIESFLKGLLGANYVFDVVDTSLCKSMTTTKLKQSYRHDFVNVHCHQIFLAALANEELNSLLDEVPDIPIHERVTLLEIKGVLQDQKFGHEIQSIKMDNIFVRTPNEQTSMRPAPPAKIATPVLARVESNSSIRTTNTGMASEKSTPVLTWAAMTAQPFVPRPGENRSNASTPISARATPLLAKVVPVPAITKNKLGQRVDFVDESIPYQELQRIKKMKLCNIYYLQGKNACDGSCNHSHSYLLKSHEKNILKEVARMTPCHYGLDCDEPACIYGHRCPQSKPGKKDCFYKDDCRFVGWGHGIDDKIVKTHNVR